MPIALAGAAIVGGIMGSHASSHAADVQSSAAVDAAKIQAASADKALDFQKGVWTQTQANEKPWLQAGQGAITDLYGMLKSGKFGDFTDTFKAPSMTDAQNDPGYEFGLTQGTKAIERTAAARGGVLSGGTAKAEGQFANDYATTKYGDVYNRAFNEYATKYNIFKQNQTDTFNRYAAISGTGQQTASQLGTLGQATSSNIGNILMTSGQQQGDAIRNAAAARASGYLGSANAWSGAINNIGMIPLLYQQYQNQND